MFPTGSFRPQTSCASCTTNGVELMALTDHDTMDGVWQAAAAAEELGVAFIPGVEISTGWGGRVVHIVGLGLDPCAPGIDAFFNSICIKRDKRGRLIGERFESLYGIRGAYEGALSLADNKDNLSRTHFARWLMQEGIVKEYQEAFDRFLKTGRPCCVDIDWPGLAEVVEVIHHSGGVAVIAHPGRYAFSEPWMLDEFLKAFKEAGGEAIEVCSGSQSREADLFFADVARRMDFLASSGSDWHARAPCARVRAVSRRFRRISRRSGASLRTGAEKLSNRLSTFPQSVRRARDSFVADFHG